MSSNVIDKYLTKKQKIIASYAKILENIITLEENSLWHKKEEFNSINEGVVENFTNKYYFDNNLNRDNPIEYLNDNINAVLLAIIAYFKKINQVNVVNQKKNETFLLSVIICTASYVDIASNVIDGDYKKMKSNLVKLLKHLNKMEILKIYYNNKIYLDKLFKEVKKNINNEKKFFNYFKSDEWYNEFQLVSENPKYYKVIFGYKMEGLEEFDNAIVKKYQKTYLKDNLNISYELLVLLLMKEFIMNKEVNTYLVPVIESSNLKILDIPLIKNNIKLLVPIDAYELYKDKGFDIIYYYKEKDKNKLLDKRDIKVLVSKDFLNENKELTNKFNDLNITLIEEKIKGKITEDVICKIKEEN